MRVVQAVRRDGCSGLVAAHLGHVSSRVSRPRRPLQLCGHSLSGRQRSLHPAAATIDHERGPLQRRVGRCADARAASAQQWTTTLGRARRGSDKQHAAERWDAVRNLVTQRLIQRCSSFCLFCTALLTLTGVRGAGRFGVVHAVAGPGSALGVADQFCRSCRRGIVPAICAQLRNGRSRHGPFGHHRDVSAGVAENKSANLHATR